MVNPDDLREIIKADCDEYKEIVDDQAFFEVYDSLDLMSLMMGIEQKYGLSPIEIPENYEGFKTLKEMAEVVNTLTDGPNF